MKAAVHSIYRYPVKGLTPEPLARTRLSPGATLPGDRAYAIENGPSGFDPAAPRYEPKTRFLMLMRNARLAALRTTFDDVRHILTIHGDGREIARGDLRTREGCAAIEAFFASFCTDELNGPPKILSAPGHSFSDVASKVVSIINLTSLAEVEKLVGAFVHPLRFRANVYVSGWPAWREFDLVGREIAIGATARLKIFKRIVRCAAVNVDPETGRRDLAIPTAMTQALGHMECGVYATVLAAGDIAREIRFMASFIHTAGLLVGLAPVCLSHPAVADPMLDALVAAYPDQLASYDGNDLVWKDGTRMPISDGRSKNFDQLLADPDIKDQFAIPYPLGGELRPPAVNEDPGRIRNEAFFRKMYGDCRKGEVSRRLKPVAWMPARHGGTVQVTSVNGVDQKLAAVVGDLAALPAGMMPYLVPSAGTYNCRPIANTHRLSVHAFGAAIDINTKFSDYWEWSKGKDGKIVWKNRIPGAIADAFERHGFIWGAKWYHFDTMHFEYRPELIALAKAGWPGR